MKRPTIAMYLVCIGCEMDWTLRSALSQIHTRMIEGQELFTESTQCSDRPQLVGWSIECTARIIHSCSKDSELTKRSVSSSRFAYSPWFSLSRRYTWGRRKNPKKSRTLKHHSEDGSKNTQIPKAQGNTGNPLIFFECKHFFRVYLLSLKSLHLKSQNFQKKWNIFVKPANARNFQKKWNIFDFSFSGVFLEILGKFGIFPIIWNIYHFS